MKTPTSRLRILLAILGVGTALLLGGCPKQVAPIKPLSPTTQRPTPTPDAGKLQSSAQETVTRYIDALKTGRYADAYELLSAESKKLHTISDFTQQGKQGVPSYDLTTAITTVTGETAIVSSVEHSEDPSTSGFHLIRENGQWKVVYRGGSPGMPYPREPSVGSKRETKQ